MTTEEKIRDILTNYGCDLDNSYPESKAIDDILKVICEEKINILEGERLKVVKLINLNDSSSDLGYGKFMAWDRVVRDIQYKINELREEGKEKGKV